MSKRYLLLVIGVGFAIVACFGSPAFAVDTYWQGPDGGLFGYGPNWEGGVAPGLLDVAINDALGNRNIIVDLGSLFAPHDVDVFRGLATGGLTMGKFSGGNPTAINFNNGMFVEAPAQINDYIINVGAKDAVWVGDPLDANTTFDADAVGFQWNIDGITGGVGAGYVGVTGTIGPGQWTVNDGLIAVGFWVRGSEGGPVIADPLDTAGTIDSGVTAPVTGPGESAWSLDGVTLKAKRILNLDQWTITRNNGFANNITATEYFEVNTMYFEGIYSDTITVGALGAPPNTGMRITQLLEATGSDPEFDDGPYIRVDELLVEQEGAEDAGAILSLEDGTRFQVIGVYGRQANPRFAGDSSLRYGFPHSMQTHLNVRNHEDFRGTLTFADESFIRAIGDPDTDEHNLLMRMEESSLNIESVVSELPARDWFTGGVDVWFGKFSTVPLEFEVIAPDVCNVWFRDVPEPRCLKYWRSLTVVYLNLRLDDNSVNHLPNNGNAEALYLVNPDTEQMALELVQFGELDLNGKRVYYLGDIDPAPPHSGYPNGDPIQLIDTAYGDFNGDCSINNADLQIMYRYLLGTQAETRALGDWDGDCDVDLKDLGEFLQHMNSLVAECDPTIGRNCPGEGAPGGGGPLLPPEGTLEVDAEGIAALADGFAVYLCRQDPGDSEEHADCEAVTTSVLALADAYLLPEGRCSIADALENPELDFASPVIAEMIPTLAVTLRQ